MNNITIIDQEVIDGLTEIGDQDFLIELIDIFLAQSEELAHEIKLSVDAKNISELKKAAHKLKGSCLNLGAKGLGDICNKVESLCQAGDISGVNQVMEPFDSVYNQTRSELTKLK